MPTTRYSLFAPLLLCLGLLPGGPAAHAQAPGWQAATAIATGFGGLSNITLTATDASGNVVVAGEFQGTITLGSFTLVANGAKMPFVAKWNVATGTWAWAQQLGGTGETFVGGLAVAGGSVYLSGSFRGSATAGSLSLSSPASFDAFVVKLADGGATASWVWAQQAGGAGDDFGYGVAAQGSSVYVVGMGQSPALTFGPATVPTSAAINPFVAKLTDGGTAGSYTWALVPGGPGHGLLSAVAVQGSSVYVGGQLQGTRTFGATSLATSGFNDADAVVAKLIDAGPTASWAWAQRAGGPSAERVAALATSGAAVYVAGSFYSSAAAFGATTLATAGNRDVFVAKLLEAGTTASWAWAQQAGGTDDDDVAGLVVRGSQVYLSGQVASSLATFGTTALSPIGAKAGYVARLADAGPTAAFAWAQAVGSPGFSTASALALGPNRLYVGGYTEGATTFGSVLVPGSLSVPYGYLATIADAALLPTTAAAAPAVPVAIAPTPAHGPATVQLPAGLAAGPATLTVLDNVGRVVRTRIAALAAGSAQVAFDVAGLAPGVYALRVAVGEHRGTARLVVE